MFLPQFAKLQKVLGPQGALAKFQEVQNSRGKQCMQSEPYINSGMKLVHLRKNELMKLLQINLGVLGSKYFCMFWDLVIKRAFASYSFHHSNIHIKAG